MKLKQVFALSAFLLFTAPAFAQTFNYKHDGKNLYVDYHKKKKSKNNLLYAFGIGRDGNEAVTLSSIVVTGADLTEAQIRNATKMSGNNMDLFLDYIEPLLDENSTLRKIYIVNKDDHILRFTQNKNGRYNVRIQDQGDWQIFYGHKGNFSQEQIWDFEERFINIAKKKNPDYYQLMLDIEAAGEFPSSRKYDDESSVKTKKAPYP